MEAHRAARDLDLNSRADMENWMLEAMPAIAGVHAGGRDGGLQQAGQIGVQAAKLRQQLMPFAGQNIASPVAYPTDGDSDFPKRLAALAAMLAAGLPMRVVSLTAPGDYDTHDNQADDLAKGLKMTADSLLAFQHDLEARGLADRVLVQVWSEFGRRGEENGSAGTDHGAAGAGFLLGTRARGQMIGEFPGLGNLDDDGNLRATADFRGIYCALLEQWFGVDAASVAARGRAVPEARAPEMRGRPAVAALLAALVVASAAAAHASPSSRAPARLLVAGDEYSLRLSRGTVEHGPALIQFMNRGEDPHDLRLKRISRSPSRTVSAPELRPGALVEIDTRLRAGHYALWCSLPGHRARGMRAVLRVSGGR